MAKYLLINEKLLEKNNLNVDELILLYKNFNKIIKLINNSSNFQFISNLADKDFLTFTVKNDYIIPTLKKKGIDLLKILMIEVNDNNHIKQVEEISKNLRLKWKGLKPGSMGSPEAITEKLNKWMISNPEYTAEQIYKAADLYLSKEGSNIKYLQRADYFVYKTENGITNSRLSAYIDEIDDFEEDGWTNELR
jgi:hypothetical protein